MEVNNAKLLKFLEAVNSNLLWLIMQLIVLSKAISTRLLTEAQHSPKILRQLDNSIRGQLMQLHPKLQQNFCESRMRWHVKPHREKFLKDNNLIVVQLWDSFLPWLMSGTFSEIPQRFQLPDAPHEIEDILKS
jgi:hypothetical protein